MIRYKSSITPIVCALLALIALTLSSLPAFALPFQNNANDEQPYLQFSVNNLVLSQTRSTNKADESQFCDGDKVKKWNGHPVQNNDELVARWLECGGRETVTVVVERNVAKSGKPEWKELEIEYTLLYASKIFSDLAIGGRTDYKTPDQLFPELQKQKSQLQEAAEQMLSESAPDALDHMQAAFRRLTDGVQGYYRSDSATFLLNRPFLAPDWARHHSDQIATATTLQSLVQRCYPLSSPMADTLPDAPAVESAGDDLESICQTISKHVDQVHKHLSAASADLSAEEKKRWNAWCRQLEPKWRGQSGWDQFKSDFHLTKKLNIDELKKAWSQSAALADALHPGGELHQKLSKLATDAPGSQTIGHVLVGGSSDSSHTLTTPVVIDFGGNDTYQFSPSGLDAEFPFRLILDLSGNDHYVAQRNGIAAGVAGVSILIDAKGDDVYKTEKNGIGFAACGLGLLVDCEGNDRYNGKQLVQGAACLGIAAVVDRDGNDIFNAGDYSQAIGLPGGLGTIIDEKGDDQFICTGKAASLYGDKGEYNAMGQGCGFGFRGLACGGIGLLQDKQGRDFYRAGQFGLGCGYFFGIGLVNDRQGSDVFECSRYGLGSAAHYAVGLVLDDGGNDIYLADRLSCVAELGSSWDLTVSALVDASGNDVYRCRTYALGGAAQNAYGIFWDKSGDDTYLTGTRPGNAGPYIGGANYGAGRGARNLSLFMDSAGNDSYSDEKTNGSSGVINEYGIWIDR